MVRFTAIGLFWALEKWIQWNYALNSPPHDAGCVPHLNKNLDFLFYGGGVWRDCGDSLQKNRKEGSGSNEDL